jgi:hypothetical protein
MKEDSPNGCKPKGFRTKELAALAVAFKEQLDNKGKTLEVYLKALSDLTDEQLQVATHHAIRELKFFPRVAELRELAGAGRAEQQDAEARVAWDCLIKFVAKYVSNDIYGNYGPEHGWYPKTFPKLSDRILDSVRRSGGWHVYKCMDADDMPFIQKRFFEEYRAWTAVNEINPAISGMLTEAPQLQLTGMTEQDNDNFRTRVGKLSSSPVVLKPVPEPLTEVQLRDRREILKQQAEILKRKKG